MVPREINEHLDKAVDRHAGRHGAAQQRLHVLHAKSDPAFPLPRVRCHAAGIALLFYAWRGPAGSGVARRPTPWLG